MKIAATTTRWAKELVADLSDEKRNQVYALKEFLRAQPRPILIYQMAKVGSTTVYQSLRDAGLYPLHVHSISDTARNNGFEYYRSRGEAAPIHLYVGRLLNPYLQLTSHRVRVITLVREPIARYVSGLRQMARFSGIFSQSVSKTQERIIERLSDPEEMEYIFGWFDQEIKNVLDVDIMKRPFNQNRGFQFLEGPRADVLVLKLERLSDLLPAVVSDFVGANLQEVRSNVGRRKKKGEKYSRVKETLQVPESIRNRIYSHEWVHHFYTEGEINSFDERWS